MSSNRSYKTINFLLSVLFLMVYSCGQLEVASIEVVNLFDPSDDEYSLPDTEFIDGPTSGMSLDSSSTVITWRHSDPAYHYDPTREVDYAERIFYRYRLNTITWSPWYNGNDLMESHFLKIPAARSLSPYWLPICKDNVTEHFLCTRGAIMLSLPYDVPTGRTYVGAPSTNIVCNQCAN